MDFTMGHVPERHPVRGLKGGGVISGALAVLEKKCHAGAGDPSYDPHHIEGIHSGASLRVLCMSIPLPLPRTDSWELPADIDISSRISVPINRTWPFGDSFT